MQNAHTDVLFCTQRRLTQRDLPNTDKKSKFLCESKSQESESGSVREGERGRGCASSCIALPFPVWVQHPRRCAHPTLSRAVVSSWVGWDTNNSNNKRRYTEESESVTTIAKRPRESASWYWRRYKNEHAQTRTHALTANTLHRDNLFVLLFLLLLGLNLIHMIYIWISILIILLFNIFN